eukprot:4727526-Pleurochrysis_carterae.AAC.1
MLASTPVRSSDSSKSKHESQRAQYTTMTCHAALVTYFELERQSERSCAHRLRRGEDGVVGVDRLEQKQLKAERDDVGQANH